MKLLNERSEMVKTTELCHHPRNPNRGDTPSIRRSIAKTGWWGAIIAQEGTGYILAGNHRFDAAVAEGATELPVIWVRTSEAEALTLMVADNRTAARATTDDEMLARVLQFLSEGDEERSETGYTDADLDRLLGRSMAISERPERAGDTTPTAPEGMRQLMFVTDVRGFLAALDALEEVCEAEACDTNAQAIALLLGRATEEGW